jgi:hypothetical protein
MENTGCASNAVLPHVQAGQQTAEIRVGIRVGAHQLGAGTRHALLPFTNIKKIHARDAQTAADVRVRNDDGGNHIVFFPAILFRFSRGVGWVSFSQDQQWQSEHDQGQQHKRDEVKI